MYAKWQADPSSVDRDWQTFFAGFDLGVARPVEDVGGAAASGQAAAGGWPAKPDEPVASIDATCFRIAELDALSDQFPTADLSLVATTSRAADAAALVVARRNYVTYESAVADHADALMAARAACAPLLPADSWPTAPGSQR